MNPNSLFYFYLPLYCTLSLINERNTWLPSSNNVQVEGNISRSRWNQITCILGLGRLVGFAIYFRSGELINKCFCFVLCNHVKNEKKCWFCMHLGSPVFTHYVILLLFLIKTHVKTTTCRFLYANWSSFFPLYILWNHHDSMNFRFYVSFNYNYLQFLSGNFFLIAWMVCSLLGGN